MLSTLPDRMFSDTAIVLTPDQQAVATSEIGKTLLALATMRERIGEGELVKGLAHTVLSCLEYNITTLSEMMAVPMQTAADVEERSARLRAANMRIRELETQIGSASASMDLAAAMGNLSSRVRNWWRQDGFGHISSLSLSEYGVLTAELSGYTFPPTRIIGSNTPISDREVARVWRSRLESRGFKMESARGGGSSIVDCEATRSALLDLVAVMPSASISTIEVRGSRDSKSFHISKIGLTIREVADILLLPEYEDD